MDLVMHSLKNAETAQWFVYIVETNNGAYYTGITIDVARRFKEHCAQSTKTAKALRGRMPLRLVYCAKVNNHSEALKAEIWIKKQTKCKKVALVQHALTLPFSHTVYAKAVASN